MILEIVKCIQWNQIIDKILNWCKKVVDENQPGENQINELQVFP